MFGSSWFIFIVVVFVVGLTISKLGLVKKLRRFWKRMWNKPVLDQRGHFLADSEALDSSDEENPVDRDTEETRFDRINGYERFILLPHFEVFCRSFSGEFILEST